MYRVHFESGDNLCEFLYVCLYSPVSLIFCPVWAGQEANSNIADLLRQVHAVRFEIRLWYAVEHMQELTANFISLVPDP